MKLPYLYYIDNIKYIVILSSKMLSFKDNFCCYFKIGGFALILCLLEAILYVKNVMIFSFMEWKA